MERRRLERWEASHGLGAQRKTTPHFSAFIFHPHRTKHGAHNRKPSACTHTEAQLQLRRTLLLDSSVQPPKLPLPTQNMLPGHKQRALTT